MATADLINALKPWTQSGVEARRAVREHILQGMDRLGVVTNDFFSTVGKAGKAVDNIIRWSERYTYSRRITGQLNSGTGLLTFSGYVMGSQAVSAATLKVHIVVGTILEHPTTKLQVIVTVTDYDNLRATVTAHGNTGSLASDGSPVEWDIIGMATTDDNETHVPKALDISWRAAGTQIFEAVFEYQHTWINISPATELGIIDKVKDQVDEITRNLREQIGCTVMRGSPTYSGGAYKYGDELQRPTMTGIFQWPRLCNAERAKPHTYVNMGGNPITDDALNSLIFYLRTEENAKYKEGDWVIVCDPVTREEISYFDDAVIVKDTKDTTTGLFIDKFKTRSGQVFPIIDEEWMGPGTLGVVNRKDCKWDYLQGCDVQVKQLETQSMTYKKLIYAQAYCTVRKPRQVGFMYGLPTSK